MHGLNLVNLLLLSAIWGGSFLFMRIGAPALGPALLIEYRVGLAALFLLVVGWFLGKRLNIRQHWKHYLILGGLNSALPFLLLAYAAQTLSASLLSILNATTPIWGAVLGALWARSQLSPKTLLGLALGAVGVTILVGFDAVTLRPGAGWSIAAALAAAFCYGLASIYARHASPVEAFANAHGSMWGATLLIAPLLFAYMPAQAEYTSDIVVSVLMLGIVCSGIAYLLYFKLIAEVGPTSALTVTFLVPVFGVLWGYLLLDEAVGWHTLFGSLTVILGTALVTGLSLRALFAQARPATSK